MSLASGSTPPVRTMRVPAARAHSCIQMPSVYEADTSAGGLLVKDELFHHLARHEHGAVRRPGVAGCHLLRQAAGPSCAPRSPQQIHSSSTSTAGSCVYRCRMSVNPGRPCLGTGIFRAQAARDISSSGPPEPLPYERCRRHTKPGPLRKSHAEEPANHSRTSRSKPDHHTRSHAIPSRAATGYAGCR